RRALRGARARHHPGGQPRPRRDHPARPRDPARRVQHPPRARVRHTPLRDRARRDHLRGAAGRGTRGRRDYADHRRGGMIRELAGAVADHRRGGMIRELAGAVADRRRGGMIRELAGAVADHRRGGVIPGVRKALPLAVVLALAGGPATAQAPLDRAKALELDTPYVPPPGDPLEHHAAAFAKIMCSAVFITGLGPDFAAENVGFFTAPYPERARLGKPVVDRSAKAVYVTLPSGVRRTARYLGDQGCVTLPAGADSPSFRPVRVRSRLPAPSTQPWPMGDVLTRAQPPAGLDAAKVKQAIDAAFGPAVGMTAAFVVTWKGHLIAERYGDGISAQTPLESWSMGKSVTASLMGVLIRQGVYDLWQPAPIPEWQGAGDPRAKIRIADLLRMSSGLRIRAPQDPDYDPSGPYPDHVYLYTGGINAFQYAATRPLQWPPGTVGRYRNTDPVLINYLVRLGVERRGEEYLSFPQRALFDKIGIRTMVLETDPYGNFLAQGYELASGRDWARLGNL